MSDDGYVSVTTAALCSERMPTVQHVMDVGQHRNYVGIV